MTLPSRVSIDSNCFVYLRDSSTPRGSFVERELIQPLIAGSKSAVVSAIALAELLVWPLRDGNEIAALELRASLEGLRGLEIVPVDAEVAERAARVRVAHGLRLPDAIHVATAIIGGAESLLTNDRQLSRAGASMPVLVLDDLVAGTDQPQTPAPDG